MRQPRNEHMSVGLPPTLLGADGTAEARRSCRIKIPQQRERAAGIARRRAAMPTQDTCSVCSANFLTVSMNFIHRCRKFRRDFYGDFRHGQLLAFPAGICTRQCKLLVRVLELFFCFHLIRQIRQGLPNLHAVRRELEGFFIRLCYVCFDPTSGAGNHDQSSGDGPTIVTSAGSALLLSDTRAWLG
jgi:hypothetical protein